MQRFEVTDKLSGLVGQHGPFEAQKEYTERTREMQRRPFRPWNSTGPNTVVEPRSQVGMDAIWFHR
jgi:hypothetical protein